MNPDIVAREWPANLYAEADLIGVCCRDRERLQFLAGFVKPGHFFRPLHSACWRALLDLFAAGRPTHEMALFDELVRCKVIGPHDHEELGDVFAKAGSGAFWDENAAIVLDLATKRELAEIAATCERGALGDRSDPAGSLIAEMQERLAALAIQVRPAAQAEPTAMADVMLEVLDRVDKRRNGEVGGLATGLVDLDEKLDGLAPGTLTLIAARPSIGKSALAVGIAAHVALTLERPVLFVTLEMSRLEIGERIAVMLTGLDGEKVHKGRLDDREMEILGRMCAQLRVGGKDHFQLAERHVRSLSQVEATCHRDRRERGLQLVVIDYLQLVETAGDVPSRTSRHEQVAIVGRRLKRLALELEIPVLAVAQLNRQPESRDDRKPRLSDLRDSGTLEQDADAVLLLHRPDFYDPADRPGYADLAVAKNRNGPTGVVPLTFRKTLMRYDNHSGAVPPEFGGDDYESEEVF